MRPVAQADGHDAPWLIDELVPRVTAVVEDVVVRFEDAVREPVVAHELPDVFLRVQFRALGRQRHDNDVGRHIETFRHVPASLIDQQRGDSARRNFGSDLGEMQIHRFDITARQHEARALTLLRTNRAEDVRRRRALILRRGRSCAAFGPSARDLVLLADARFIGEPDFYRGYIDALFTRDFLQARGELFLNSSIAPSA